MGLSKPYYRIARPKAYIPDYVTDSRYASDRLQLSRAYVNIEKELRDIFNHVEPDEVNKNTFSFELYTLLLKACTEVELNCKEILEANGALPLRRCFTMEDYKKIEKSSLLSKYKVVFPNWRKRTTAGVVEYIRKELCPFANFAEAESTKGKSPDWYVAYNEVKHNREANFENANLENCMNAVAGILVLLYSQFGAQCIETYGISSLRFQEMDAYDNDFDADVIFEINPPQITDWNEAELYDFNWNELKANPEPFEKYILKHEYHPSKIPAF